MKKRLKDEGNESVTNCNALKLKAQDGKYRLTDVVTKQNRLNYEYKEVKIKVNRLSFAFSMLK